MKIQGATALLLPTSYVHGDLEKKKDIENFYLPGLFFKNIGLAIMQFCFNKQLQLWQSASLSSKSINKEQSIKEVSIQGEGGLTSASILRIRGYGVLGMRTSALLVQKNFKFFEIYGVSERTRAEVACASTDILRTKGDRGLFFATLCRPLL